MSALGSHTKMQDHAAFLAGRHDFQGDIERLAASDLVGTILETVMLATNMRFAGVARVTADRWVACRTIDEVRFGIAAGDEIARRAVARSGRAIGQAIASATALVDLDVVAIGGGFSHVTPDIFDMIREPIAEHIQFGFVTKVRVVPSGLSGDGPLIGAAALIHRSELIAD